MEQSPSLDTGSLSISEEIPHPHHVLWKQKVHYRIQKGQPPVLCPYSPPCFLKVRFNIFLDLSLGLQVVSSIQALQPIVFKHFK
jgi:hypothetical protein